MLKIFKIAVKMLKNFAPPARFPNSASQTKTIPTPMPEIPFENSFLPTGAYFPKMKKGGGAKYHLAPPLPQDFIKKLILSVIW